jgi:hypothetical protein
MSDYRSDPTLVAITLALEALELRLAEATASVSMALADAARGRRNGAVGAVLPLAVSLPEASALIASVLVLHRHGQCGAASAPELFPE